LHTCLGGVLFASGTLARFSNGRCCHSITVYRIPCSGVVRTYFCWLLCPVLPDSR
jgi:hypothetical protein